MNPIVRGAAIATAIAASVVALHGCTGVSAIAPGAAGRIQSTTPPASVATATPAPARSGSAILFGTLSLPANELGLVTGNCVSGVIFTSVGQTANFVVIDPGFQGSFTLTNSAPAVASATIVNGALNVTTLALGATTLNVSDGVNTSGCYIVVSTLGASPTPIPTVSATASATPSGAPSASPPTPAPGQVGQVFGNCTNGVYFTAAGASASFAVSEPGYSGLFAAISSQPSVVAASIVGSTLTLSAIAPGSATVTITDTFSRSTPCSVYVLGSAATPTPTPSATPTASPSPTPASSPVAGMPSTPPGQSGSVTGNCTSGVNFSTSGLSAMFAISETGYSGAFSATSNAPTVATGSMSGATLTITSIGGGSAIITVTDSGNRALPCSVTVTGATGTLQSIRKGSVR